MFAPGHVDVYSDVEPFLQDKPFVSQKQIRQIVISEISSGSARPGDKVPSIRVLSAQLGVSQAIIRRAFAQLLAEGWLEMRHGSGTYVSESSRMLILNNCGRTNSYAQMRLAPENARHSGIFGVPEVLDGEPITALTDWDFSIQNTFDGGIIYGLSSAKTDLNFLPSFRSHNLLKGARWDQAIEQWKSDCARMPGLTDPAGMIELRHEIADWLRKSKGMSCTMNDVIIVNGAQEGRQLLARLLVDKGTRTVFEEPGSLVHRMLFQSYGAEMVPVSVDESGLVVDELNAIKDASLLYATPVAQFPTGAVFSRARKIKIAEWAEETGAIVIEDESSSEFIYESRVSPSIAAHDKAGRTVYIGSFSQMLPAEWQIGFIVAPPAFRVPLLRAKSLTNRCTSPLVQSLVRRMLEAGFVQEYIRRMQRQNDERRLHILECLKLWNQEDIAFSPVKGGLSQTIWLRPGLDDVAIARRGAENGLAVTPVSPCFMRQPSQPGLVLNFSGFDRDSLPAAMTRLQYLLLDSMNRESDWEGF